MNDEKIKYWRSVWNKIYAKALPPSDLILNSAGWISSYTNVLIPDEEIIECLDSATSKILGLSPKNVLEIGCGTGMILFRIAPHCNSYWGTDISEQAIEYILATLPSLNLDNVRLFKNNEDSLIYENEFDTIIINSVIQYFPSLRYLDKVIKRALDLLKGHGTIFIGDVRPKQLLGLFNAAVEFHWAKDEMPIEDLWNRITFYIDNESELLVDPIYFINLEKRFNKISRVEIKLKPFKRKNEISLFRYDVILHVGETVKKRDVVRKMRWSRQPLSVLDIQQFFAEYGNSDKIEILGVPNARIANEITLWRLLSGASRGIYQNVGQLRNHLNEIRYDNFIEPNDVFGIGKVQNIDVELFWSSGNHPGYFDIMSPYI